VANGAQLVTVPVGKWQEVELEGFNEGNSDVRVTIEKDNLPKNSECNIGVSSFTIREGELKIIDISIKHNSGGARLNVFTLKLEGVSGNSNWIRIEDIVMKSDYSPTTFTNTIWSKVSIGALIILVLVIVASILFERSRKKNISSGDIDDMEI